MIGTFIPYVARVGPGSVGLGADSALDGTLTVSEAEGTTMKLLSGLNVVGPSVVVGVMLIFAIHGRSEATTVLGGNDVVNRAQIDGFTNFTILDRNHPISTNGTVTAWEIYARDDLGMPFDSLQLVIFRVTPAEFSIVGTSELRTPTQTGVNIFVLASPIEVQAGDLVGLRYTGKASVPFDSPSSGFPRGDFDGTMLFTSNNSGLTNIFVNSSDRTYSVRVITTAAPIARADSASGLAVLVGDMVTLNGSASSDPDQDPLAFSWTLTVVPSGSGSVLTGQTTEFPTFTPDVPGDYTARLTVSDPFGGLATDDVTVTAEGGADFVKKQIMQALNLIGDLKSEQVTSRGNQKALQQFLGQALAALRSGDMDRARDKLMKSIDRTDGCVLHGEPDHDGDDRRDWITDCAAQAGVYQLLTTALAALGP